MTAARSFGMSALQAAGTVMLPHFSTSFFLWHSLWCQEKKLHRCHRRKGKLLLPAAGEILYCAALTTASSRAQPLLQKLLLWPVSTLSAFSKHLHSKSFLGKVFLATVLHTSSHLQRFLGRHSCVGTHRSSMSNGHVLPIIVWILDHARMRILLGVLSTGNGRLPLP